MKPILSAYGIMIKVWAEPLECGDCKNVGKGDDLRRKN